MPDALEQASCRIGENLFCFEPPDLFILVTAGYVTASVVSAVYEGVERLSAGRAPLFRIIDFHRLTGVAPEARKIAVERQKHITFRGSALIGGNRAMRALASLSFRAFSLLAPSDKDDPVRFFKTGEEARAWISERRRAVQREAPR